MTPKPIRVLLVEDAPTDARLLQEALVEGDPTQFKVTHVPRLSEALLRLGEEACDVVLLDLGLPDSHGLDTLTLARAQVPHISFVVLTGFKDEALAVKAVQEGAQDYLFKGQVDSNLLTRSLRYAIERKRAQEALREMEVEAARLAYLEESRRRILAAQEQVRKEIAQELHGPVQTRLLVLQQRMQGISKRLDTPTGDVRREIAELADQLGDVRENQIRSISHRLHPSIIAMGVAASLRSLRDHLERAILIELEIDTEVAEMEGAGLSSISEEVRLGLYRVAEEALANVLKHSKAFVRLGTGPEPETLLLSIADDGEGFEPENTVRGLGFTTIDDYLGALGGSFTLETAPGRGTRITVTIPLRHAPGGQPGQTTS